MRAKSHCRKATSTNAGLLDGMESTHLGIPPRLKQRLLASAAERFRDPCVGKSLYPGDLLAIPRV